jgi:hypothetical protein
MGNDFDPELRLEDAEGFLTTLAFSPGIYAWQVEQATDGVTILLGSAFGKDGSGRMVYFFYAC